MDNSTIQDFHCPVPFPCLPTDLDCSITDIESLFMSGIIGYTLKTVLTYLVLLPIKFWSLPFFIVMSLLKGTYKALRNVFGSNENLNNGDKRKGKTSQAREGNLQETTNISNILKQNGNLQHNTKAISRSGSNLYSNDYSTSQPGHLINNGRSRSRSLPVIGLKKNDKHEKRLNEILENHGEYLTDEECEENGHTPDIGSDPEEGKENIQPILGNNPVMGIRAKQEFVNRWAPGGSQRVGIPLPTKNTGPNTARSLSHLQFQNPTPYYKKATSDLQNEIKNFQFKRKPILKPEREADADYNGETRQNVVKDSGVENDNQHNKKIPFDAPIPKPRLSILKQNHEVKLIRPQPKPRKLNPFEWWDSAKELNNGLRSVTTNSISIQSDIVPKQDDVTSSHDTSRTSSIGSSADNDQYDDMESFIIVNVCPLLPIPTSV